MIRRCLALSMLAVFIILASGCETVKGAAEGMKKDWAALQKADAWFRKNLW